MNAPNRSDSIKRTMARLESHLTVHKRDMDNIRRRTLPECIADMPADERPKWGVMVKTDEHDKIPVDILMWKDTGEHIDVNTAKETQPGSDMRLIKAVWDNHGVNDKIRRKVWVWCSVADAKIPPLTDEPPPPPPPPPSGDLEAQVRDLQQRVKVIEDWRRS